VSAPSGHSVVFDGRVALIDPVDDHGPEEFGLVGPGEAARFAKDPHRAVGQGVVEKFGIAAVFLDIQCTTLLVQMALGEDPELLGAQAALAFAGLTGMAGDFSATT
jgi:hypothetical protein